MQQTEIMSCCGQLAALRFFAFLQSGEFTAPEKEEYNLREHLYFKDIVMDNVTDPGMISVRATYLVVQNGSIHCSSNDLSWMGRYSNMSRSRSASLPGKVGFR